MRAYKLVFQRLQPAVQVVLQDLAVFCGAVETPAVMHKDGSLDVNKTMVMLGRHEVWMRIQAAINLRPVDVYALAQRQPIAPTVEEERTNA